MFINFSSPTAVIQGTIHFTLIHIATYMYMHVYCLYNFIVHVDQWHVFAENTHSSMTQLKTIFQHLRVLCHAHTLFVEPLLGAQYLRNSCSLLYTIKAAVEALARIIYKPTKSASSINIYQGNETS